MAKEKRYSRQQVRAFMKQAMPGCPTVHREQIAHRVKKRSWSDCSLAEAVGIASHSYIRHNLTDYHAWLHRYRLNRDEARQIVKAELDDIFRSWQASGKDETRCAS